MPPAAKFFLSLGGVFALSAVVIGAFGAHGLKARLSPEMLAVYQTGVQYHFYHALGMILVGLAFYPLADNLPLRLSGAFMGAGIVLFSGSLYALALTGQRWLGAVAPVGGTAFILAWGAFVWAVASAR